MEGRNAGGMEGNQREGGSSGTHTGTASGSAWLAQAADSLLFFFLSPVTSSSSFSPSRRLFLPVDCVFLPSSGYLSPPYVLLTPPHRQ